MGLMVPLTGLEPVRVLPHGILSPGCLPNSTTAALLNIATGHIQVR